jgi:hypothetical protein
MSSRSLVGDSGSMHNFCCWSMYRQHTGRRTGQSVATSMSYGLCSVMFIASSIDSLYPAAGSV